MAQLQTHTKRVVKAFLQGTSVRALNGSMVAYEGDVSFKSAGFGGGDGIAAGLKRRVAGEGLKLMECTGNGVVYFAVNGQEVVVIDLNNETLSIESEHLLVFAGNLRTDVAFSGMHGLTAGQGLATTTVTGQGQVAILSSGGPLIHLEVTPETPLVVDPDAFVAARGNLQQSMRTDVGWRNMVGRGNDEAFSILWQGHGVVSIQPAER